MNEKKATTLPSGNHLDLPALCTREDEEDFATREYGAQLVLPDSKSAPWPGSLATCVVYVYDSVFDLQLIGGDCCEKAPRYQLDTERSPKIDIVGPQKEIPTDTVFDAVTPAVR